MQDSDLEAIRGYIMDRLTNELAAELTYHDSGHTLEDVVPAALRLGRRSGLTVPQMRLLEVAALFHDLGYVECSEGQGHEEASVRLARDILPRFGLASEEIDVVADTIMATRLPQTPRDLLGQIMADADLDVLGRDVFFHRNDALRREFEVMAGNVFDDCVWYEDQIRFLGEHDYFTAAAHELRDAGKRANLDELRQRLDQARNGGCPG